ncbi:MAG: hypothetical protein IID08_10750 [Candidatus Hydrogenedentes bacterium]|nr:hypothetical protein [Candidatus Hydrogenedentota bacterium]
MATNESITLSLDPKVYEFFERITREEGRYESVEEYLEHHVTSEVASYFRGIETAASLPDREGDSLADIIGNFLSHCDEGTARSFLGMDCWPWIEDDDPRTFEELMADAELRGRKKATQWAQEGRRRRAARL